MGFLNHQQKGWLPFEVCLYHWWFYLDRSSWCLCTDLAYLGSLGEIFTRWVFGWVKTEGPGENLEDDSPVTSKAGYNSWTMASLQARAKEFVSEEDPTDSVVNASPELQQLANSTAPGMEECACASQEFVGCISVFMHFLEIVGPKLAGRFHDGMLGAIAISIVLSVMKLAC